MNGIILSLFLLTTSSLVYSDDTHQYHEKKLELKQLVASNEETFRKQQGCLAKTIYFEASDHEKAQIAVANVVINRAENEDYPVSICGVVQQKTRTPRGKTICQFSYQCETHKQIVEDSDRWESAQEIAIRLLSSIVDGSRDDNTEGATHFHDIRVYPNWARSHEFIRTLKTSSLSFYKKR
jgi:spore germination cell wall hydrolase CwlJ-like protein